MDKNTDVPPSEKYNRAGVLRRIKVLQECGYKVDIDYANNRLYFGKEYAGPAYIDMDKVLLPFNITDTTTNQHDELRPDQLLSDIKSAKDSGNIDVLIAFLSHSNSMVRRNAVIAIGELGDKKALEHLISLLDSEFCENVLFTQLISDIAIAIGKMPDPKGREALTKIEQSMIDEAIYHGRIDDTTLYGKHGQFKIVPSNVVRTVREQMKVISDTIGIKEAAKVCETPEVSQTQGENAELIGKLEGEKLKWEEERRLQTEREKRDKVLAALKSKIDETKALQQVTPQNQTQKKAIQKCAICNKFPEEVYECKYCGKRFCEDHYIMTAHNCPGLKGSIDYSKKMKEIEEPPKAVVQGVVDSSSVYLLEDASRWIKSRALYLIVSLLLLIIIGVVVGVVVMNGSHVPGDISLPEIPITTPMPTAMVISPSSYMGTWVGQDATGEQTLTIMSNGKFEHKITSNGAVRLFTGTYIQQWNGLSLQYDNFSQGINYNADLRAGDNTATFEANGYVPGMPVTVSFTRGS